MPEKPTALIFRTRLLPFSETFIQSQSAAMTRYRPFYVGLRRVNGIDLPAQAKWIANTGNLAGLGREIRFRSLGPNSRMRQELEKVSAKLLHAHFAPDACEALTLATLLRIPLICTCHGYDVTVTDAFRMKDWRGRLFLRRRPKLQTQATSFIAVSRFIRTMMLEQGYPENKIRLHYIGVDTRLFQPPQEESRKRQVLFAGRLVEKKGCSYLIDAMSAVQRIYPEVELIIIGDGPQRAALEQQANRSLRMYRFLGEQSPATVMKWMQTVALFCVPSVIANNGDAEGFGMVFAEAQASGLPVVSFSSGGIPEAVAHEETGLLVPERDTDQLTRALLLLLENPALRSKFGRAGRSRIERYFDLRRQSQLLEDIYDEITAGIAQRVVFR